MSMVTPSTNPVSETEMPVLHTCPTCGAWTDSIKMRRFAAAWELVWDTNYPSTEPTIPCVLHGAA